MKNFTVGFIFGMVLIGSFTVYIPESIRGVQSWLVEQNHGNFNSITRNFELKECK